MNAKRLAAVVVIFIATTIAWMALGGATMIRSQDNYDRLGYGWDGGERATVQQLWGTAQTQRAPQVWTTHMEKQARISEKGKRVMQDVVVTDPVVVTKSRITASLDLDPRRKGLLWYSTYHTKFAGVYAFKSDFPNQRKFFVRFRFPEGQAAFDNVLIHMNGKRQYPGGDLTQGVVAPVILAPGAAAELKVSYGSQGMDRWSYQFADDSAVSSVRGFEAVIHTNCADIDFPENCLSPTHKQFAAGGWTLRWQYGDLISSSNIGITMPQKLQPGPVASRLSMFAPVSLFFFFAVLIILGTVRGINLHPMHYFFLAATFFSFHLLFSYLVDHVTPFNAFLIASAVSLLLTISYLRLAVNWKFAVTQAGLWQFVFLVLFTYAFFFEGYTGLTVTIGAILTLAVLMHITARVKWDEKFGASAS